MGVFTRRIIKEDLDKVNVFLEDTKNEIKSKLIEITNEQKDLAQKLEEKYGPGKLSLETGEIEPFQ